MNLYHHYLYEIINFRQKIFISLIKSAESLSSENSIITIIINIWSLGDQTGLLPNYFVL